ncbi:MAG TPA: NYN domain-containing protein, partial [Candidatus Nanoarchaeia archaeon]|nr:NYN domain-containing protein [Candidatus Nanoarchaeia archaeon]
KRVCVYIDGANFYGGLRSINQRYTDEKFDFENYIKYLTKNCSLIKIYYYNASLKQQLNKEPFRRQQKLFSRLRKMKNCEVILCKRKPRISEEGEEYHIIKGDDVCLALDMLGDAYENKYDKAILISSDGDFAPLIERVKKLKKEVDICYFAECVSDNLINLSDNKHTISKKIVKRFFYVERKKKQENKIPPEKSANQNAVQK